MTVVEAIRLIDRKSAGGAFEDTGEHSVRLEELRQASYDSLLNVNGVVSPIQRLVKSRDELREPLSRMGILIPALNQEGTIGGVLDYLFQLGIDPRQVLVVSNSSDGTDSIVQAADVEVIKPLDVLDEHLTSEGRERMLEILHADNMAVHDPQKTKDILRGKGRDVWAGHMHLAQTGRLSGPLVEIDSDIGNYGLDDYDPVSHFAWALNQSPDARVVKVAKSGRGNEGMRMFVNGALPYLGAEGPRYQQGLGVLRWPLTGEFIRHGSVVSRSLGSTGYAVEMVRNLSDIDIAGVSGVKQVEIEAARRDDANTIEKEEIMYAVIMRTVGALVRTGRKLIELNFDEIQEINAALVAENHPIFVADESHRHTGATPQPNAPREVESSRVIPSILALRKAGILKAVS